MIGRKGRLRRAFRRTALPLASYYAVTLALPVANGAELSGPFVEHAIVVLLAPPALVALACAAGAVAASSRRHATYNDGP